MPTGIRMSIKIRSGRSRKKLFIASSQVGDTESTETLHCRGPAWGLSYFDFTIIQTFDNG